MIVDGVIQATPFLDLTAITLADLAGARAALGRVRAGLRDVGPVLRVPHREDPGRRDPDPRVPPLGGEPEPRRPGQRPHAAHDPARRGEQPQRRAAADRAGRPAVAGDRRRRRRRTTVRQRAEPELAARQAAQPGPDRGHAGRPDALARPAQPVAVLVHARRRDRDRRRRPEPVRGGQRRARRQLRLAVPRGRAPVPHDPARLRRASRPPTRCSRRPTTATTSARSPAATSCATRACRRCSAATCTATSASRRCAP